MDNEQAINIAKGCVMASYMDNKTKQAVIEALNQTAISKTENVGCWYCKGIESHGIATVKTVCDEFGRELTAYNTPYNYCPNCGRKVGEPTCH